jgi:xylan 1,4-beta-xylosidase
VPQIVNVQSDTTLRVWEKLVADDINITATQHTLARAGQHTLKFWAVDPGIVLQKIVIEARAIPQSYLGPPESYHRPVADRSPRRAAQPAAAVAPLQAKFDWFEYTGSDSVYKTLTPNRDSYFNPILAGFYPDPSIARVGDDYYLVNSSFAYFPGVPIFRSRDLVHWAQLGHVLDRPSQLPLDSAGISRGIFAPVIREHAGTFYMITTLIDRGGNFFVTATNPAGPWSEPTWLPEVDGIDPSFFFDDDGKAYVINNGPPIGTPLYNGHRAIWIQEFDIASKKMVGPRSLIVNGGVDLAKKPIWIEAPHIFKREGRYYLICAEGGTADQHSEVVFRSDAVGGPYVPFSGNPILTQRQLDPSRPFPITSTGHADFVETPTGEWWAVFLGTRPYGDDTYNTGRETFLLPVKWTDGWPVILQGNATVPYQAKRPGLVATSPAAVPMSGNFTVRDDFKSPTLAPYWTFIRTPREKWYSLSANTGTLAIDARPAKLGSNGQLSFIGRRQQHLNATASTALRFTPSHDDDAAGLVAFQNDEFYYFIGVTMVGGARVVRVVERAGKLTDGAERVLGSAPLDGAGPVYLKIVARGARYDFLYALKPDAWKPLFMNADGTVLSTKVAGGFVGTMFGMYAYSPGR